MVWGIAAAALALLSGGCRSVTPAAADGEAMIIAGQRRPVGTRIVTWRDPQGYDAYSGRPGPSPRDACGDQRNLRELVDQIVVHYDACGLSRLCFAALQTRGLSAHFLIDIDGTVYQTLDLRETALHTTVANRRSIGIELANIGAYPPDASGPLAEWYRRDAAGLRISVPAGVKEPGILTPGFVGRPVRPEEVGGRVQDRPLRQYDFTAEQYAALIRLTAALCREFPRIRCDYPRDRQGRPLTRKMSDAELARYRGLLGHCHVQANKVDPGPAFQWETFLAGVRRELK